MRSIVRRVDASEVISRATSHYNAAMADGCGVCGHGDRNTKASNRTAFRLRLPATPQPRQFHTWRASCKQNSCLEGFKVKPEKGAKMSVQLQIEEIPSYLKARFDGASTIEEAKQQFTLLAEKCKGTNKNKLLLDFTTVPANISLADRYALGRLTLVFAQYKCRVAAVCKTEQHGSTCFIETVAQNRWVDLRVFTNVEDALEWLLK
jgi:hypothetical protein